MSVNIDAEREEFEGSLYGGPELEFDHTEKRYKHAHIEWQWMGWLARARFANDVDTKR